MGLGDLGLRPPSSQVRTSDDVTYGAVVDSVKVSVFE
jgi:hypothetical protein